MLMIWQAIERDANNAVFFHNRGFTYRNMGSYEKAIEDYTRAIELNPKNSAAYNNRGFARRKLCQFNAAIEDYTVSLQLNPNNVKTYNNRGYSYVHLSGCFRLSCQEDVVCLPRSSGV